MGNRIAVMRNGDPRIGVDVERLRFLDLGSGVALGSRGGAAGLALAAGGAEGRRRWDR